jgi:hypothetical protein
VGEVEGGHVLILLGNSPRTESALRGSRS